MTTPTTPPVAAPSVAPAAKAGDGGWKHLEGVLAKTGLNVERAKADLADLDSRFQGEHGHIPHQAMVNWVTAHFSNDQLLAMAFELGQRWEDEITQPGDRAWERDPNGKRPDKPRADAQRDFKGREVADGRTAADGRTLADTGPVGGGRVGTRRADGSYGFVERRKTEMSFGGTYDRRRTSFNPESNPSALPAPGRLAPDTLERDAAGNPINPTGPALTKAQAHDQHGKSPARDASGNPINPAPASKPAPPTK